MARFTVYRSREGDQLLLDCQADRFRHQRTRFVVPLLPKASIASRVGHMHPEFVIEGHNVVMATQLATAVLAAELGNAIATLAHEDHRIVRAIDTLIGTA